MRAVDVTNATAEIRGFQHDRRWLAVNSNGVFLTQRGHPQLATITATPTASGISLSTKDFGKIEIDHPVGNRRRKIVVWDAEVDAAAVDERATTYLSELLGEEAHLVFMDEKALRLKTSLWTPTPVPVSFADAFPVLVTTTGSLTALNSDIEQHGGTSIPMARFRPNLVVDCEDAWAEDHWKRLQIGEVVLDLVKPADRCVVTTTDQNTGVRMGNEPLASLARIRRSTDPRINGVIFGVNALPLTMGKIRVGEAVEIID